MPELLELALILAVCGLLAGGITHFAVPRRTRCDVWRDLGIHNPECPTCGLSTRGGSHAARS